VSRPVLLSLVTSLILSRLEYGSVTLAGIHGYLLDRHQSVLHAVARLVNRARKHDQSHHCFGTCIGCGSPNALNIDWLCWFTAVVTTLHPSTWPGTSTGSPTMTLDDVCDRQQHSSSRSLGRDSAQSAIRPFKSPVLVCGMLCPSVVCAPSLTVFKSHLMTHLFQQQSYRHSH